MLDADKGRGKGRKTVSLPLSDSQNRSSAFLPVPTEN